MELSREQWLDSAALVSMAVNGFLYSKVLLQLVSEIPPPSMS